ncbi:long-chain fatty acid--CoA ligase [Peribacillus asahii]|uniref:long-chain-fatty-acid--CoA ligase n=1 Tax=Peribacillus asahii TaxID=228899 RepID=UPI0037FFA694
METEQVKPWNKYYEEIKDTFHIPHISLYNMLEASVQRFGEQPVIIFEDREITYQELKRRVDCLAQAWMNKGVQQGDRIGIMVTNHPDYIVSYYAAHALGAIVVQINPAYTPRELLQIVQDSEVSYIVVDARSVATVDTIREVVSFKHITLSTTVNAREIGWGDSINELIESTLPIQQSTPINPVEDVAIIQYTGGTTGKVKGAMLTHYNLVANVYQSFVLYRQRVEFGQETVLTVTPLYHVYAMTAAMNLGIYLGARLLVIEKFNVDHVLQQVKKHRPTMFPGVPKMYISFVNHPNAATSGLESLKVCSSGSAPLPVEIIHRFKELTGASILEGFGMSETSPTTHRTPINGEHKVGSIGIPVPETDCKIVDEDNKELGANMVGELLIKGPQVTKGYWNNVSESAQALQNGWLHTGDLATMDEEGYFYIVGRKKEMIILGGFNIYPQEVEGVLYEHPDVQEAAVVGIPDRDNGEMVKAYVVPKNGCTLDLDEIRGYCYTKLTPYKVPKIIEVRDQLPRNGVGKLLKRLLIKEELEKGGE